MSNYSLNFAGQYNQSGKDQLKTNPAFCLSVKKYPNVTLAKIPRGLFVVAFCVSRISSFSSCLSFMVNRRVLMASWLFTPPFQPSQSIVSTSPPSALSYCLCYFMRTRGGILRVAHNRLIFFLCSCCLQ